MRIFRNALIVFAIVVVILGAVIYMLAQTKTPDKIQYGMTFSTVYSRELGLNWKEVYEALLTDMQVRHFRLIAYWPEVEPRPGEYDFDDLDYQLKRADQVNADVILAVGRRVPRWPECHIPDWASTLAWEQQKQDILSYITTVVNRYKNEKAITYWQVENEPYLTVFATDYCGNLDEAFLEEEIALVHKLDPSRPVLVTDSGNLGSWFGAYKHGDAFGTSVYIYFWNQKLGEFKTILPPWFYRLKGNVMGLLYGKKETMLIELSGEPWLVEPIESTDLQTQFSRMNPTIFKEVIQYAKDTHLQKQYLWGAEWWYWLKQKGYPQMWDAGKELFTPEAETDH